VRDFVSGEIIEAIFTFGTKTIINSFLAGIWPMIWISRMGLAQTGTWAGEGYIVWAVILSVLLARRETQYHKKLGL
jgi:hypothetical protein